MLTSRESLKDLLGNIGAKKAVISGKGFSVSAGKEVKISVAREVSSELKVVTQALSLSNTKSKRSQPINDIKILELALNITLKDEPFVVAFGGMAGMQNTGYYPPPAYQLREVMFGEREKGDTKMSATRWWGGHRHFEVGSGEDGLACSPDLPIMFFGWKESNKEKGFWVALEWTGRWQMEAYTDKIGKFILSAKIPVTNMVLSPKETLVLPKVHIGYFEGSRENGFNSFRRYIMEKIAPNVEGKRPEAFLAYDHWMGIHGDLTEKNMKPQVKAAAELGLDYFVADAGWFGGMEKGWMNAVGNWERVSKDKFPNGLKPLANLVKENHMRFGMWFEPERAVKGSDWQKKYKEGFIRAGERFMIDLSKKEMQDVVINMLSGYIQDLDIRWLRWDHNQAPGSFWDVKDPTGKYQFYYVKGLYRVWDTLLKMHPKLLLDLGWRMDLGSMKRSATTIMADYAEDPHVVRIMQTSASRVIPGNYLNGFTYQGKNDALILSPLKLISRMAGSFTLGGCISRYSKKQQAELKKYLDGYRSFKHLLTKNFFALSDAPKRSGEPDIVEYADYDGAEAVILAFKVRGKKEAYRVFPKGLLPGKKYKISDPFSNKQYGIVSGKTLMSKGIVFTLKEDSAIVRRIVSL